MRNGAASQKEKTHSLSHLMKRRNIDSPFAMRPDKRHKAENVAILQCQHGPFQLWEQRLTTQQSIFSLIVKAHPQTLNSSHRHTRSSPQELYPTDCALNYLFLSFVALPIDSAGVSVEISHRSAVGPRCHHLHLLIIGFSTPCIFLPSSYPR